MKIQYTSYGVTVWTDSDKAYTAATEEEAREWAEKYLNYDEYARAFGEPEE